MINSHAIELANAPHYIWGAACDTWVLLDTETLSVKQELMQAGATEVLHMHLLSQQFFYILKGDATFTINDERILAKAGQGLHIPAGSKHFIANESSSELSFIVISQPSTNNDRENLL